MSGAPRGGSEPLVAATAHINTDTDALASLVALHRLLGPLALVLPGAMDAGARRLHQDHADDLPPIVPLRAFREAVAARPGGTLHVVDTARADRLGPLEELLPRFASVRCWDTHPARDGDFPREPLERAAACTASLVLELDRRGATPTRTEAGLFLVGIHEDTGHFTFRETTEADHRAAALCLGWGADPAWTERYCPRGFTSEQLELLETMARTARFVRAGDHEVPILTLELDRYVPELSTLVGQLRAAEGWPAAFLVAALSGRIYAIGRSDGRVDAAAVLEPLGGGGRPTAASASVAGLTLTAAVESLALALGERGGRRTTARDLAVRQFVSLRAECSVQDAADTMHRHGVNALPLSREADGRIDWVGMVSRRDVDRALRHGLGDRPAEEISARPPAWVPEDAPLSEIRARLLGGGGRLLLVGDPLSGAGGIVTRTTALLAGAGEPALAPPRRGPHPELLLRMTERALGPAWPHVEALGRIAGELGMGASLVGGCVRDVLLEREVGDVDVVVEGSAPGLARTAAKRLGGRVNVHDAFATARWLAPDGIRIDLATARTEYSDAPASLPRIAHAELRRDLYRRDFTINAMAITIDPSGPGRLHDPYNGFDDLRTGLLRVLHGLSFHDDPTRAFRAARFAARLDVRLAPQTEALMRAALRTDAFDRLGRERLGHEIDAILAEPEVEQAIRLLRDWRLLERVHPALPGGPELFDRIAAARDARSEFRGAHAPGESVPTQADVLWIVLADLIPRDERVRMDRIVPGARDRRRHWRDGPDRIREAARRVARANDRAQQALVLGGLAAVLRIVLLAAAHDPAVRDAVRWWEREGRSIEPAVDGEALIASGVSPGPDLGRALAAARAAAWNGADADAQRRAARGALEGPR